MRGAKPIAPEVHPTAPERALIWHSMMIKRLEARKTWRVLARHLLFELRACPVCGLAVFRWRRNDEIRIRVLAMAVRAANGNIALAAQRLKMTRRTLYDNLPQKLRDRIGTGRKKSEDEPK